MKSLDCIESFYYGHPSPQQGSSVGMIVFTAQYYKGRRGFRRAISRRERPEFNGNLDRAEEAARNEVATSSRRDFSITVSAKNGDGDEIDYIYIS